jgi:hypothetical protein
MESSTFKGFFFLVVILMVVMFAAQLWFGKTMYESCIEEGKSKAQCLKMLNREMGGRGHNITVDEE